MKMPSLIKKSIYAQMPIFQLAGKFGDPNLLSKLTTKNMTGNLKQDVSTNLMDDVQLDMSGNLKQDDSSNYQNPTDMLRGTSLQHSVDGYTPEEDKEDNTWGNLRDSMYIGNALFRGMSERNARDQQNEYLQTNLANPLANMASNDGRSKQSEFGYEQFAEGGRNVSDTSKQVINWRQRDLDAINGKTKNQSLSKEKLDSISKTFNRAGWENQIATVGYKPLSKQGNGGIYRNIKMK